MSGITGPYEAPAGLKFSGQPELARPKNVETLFKITPHSSKTRSSFILYNDMRSLPGHRLILCRQHQRFCRTSAQQWYVEQIKEDSNNWRWYYHLALEMVHHNLPCMSIENKTVTAQDLLLQAIAINPNERRNWVLLSENWPGDNASLQLSFEGGKQFSFNKKDAIGMVRELDAPSETLNKRNSITASPTSRHQAR